MINDNIQRDANICHISDKQTEALLTTVRIQLVCTV